MTFSRKNIIHGKYGNQKRIIRIKWSLKIFFLNKTNRITQHNPCGNITKEYALTFLNTYWKSKGQKVDIFRRNGMMVYCSKNRIYDQFLTYGDLEFEFIGLLDGTFRIAIRPKKQLKLPWGYFYGANMPFKQDKIEQARKVATALVSLGVTYKESI